MRIALLSLTLIAGCTSPIDPVAVVEGGDDEITTLVFDADAIYDADRAAPVQDLGFTFARVGVRFTAQDSEALELRASIDGSAWSAWAKPSIYFSEESAHAGHLDVGSARFVQHRVAEGAATPTFVVIEPVREIPADIPPMEIDTVESSTLEAGLNVTINSRASWGARAPRCKSFTGVRKATVHHTAGPNDDSTPVTVQLRQIQSFHQNSRGWCDVGYNFLISRDGRIWEGRGYGVLGAHAENANSDNMGISLIGTYTSSAPPMAMQVAAAKTLRYLKDRAGIPLTRDGDNGVKGHRQRGTTSTTCPGDALYGRLGSIVTMAKNGDFDVGPPVPAGCRTGNFDGDFCDDDNSSSETAHDRLKAELGVDFRCANIAGEPAFCGGREITRAQAISVLGRAAGMPVSGHPNAFPDDNGHANERSMNAAKAFGIFVGERGNPDGKATRSTLAIMVKRMYLLPAAARDYFDDDENDAHEDTYNRVAAAGLFTGFTDANGGKKDFKPTAKANRDTLAILAVRAADKGLVPVWDIPQKCIDGDFTGNFCDDDGNAGAQADHDRLIDEAHLPGMFCSPLAGSPRFCASKEASRAMSLLVLAGSAGMPLSGHPDAFNDDDDHPRERYFDAAKAFGIIGGYEGGTKMKPSLVATRDTLAIMLARMYALPASNVDAFTDDDGSPSEVWHDKVAAAGLFTGFSDGNGGFEFRGDRPATKGQLATLAKRAKIAPLIPVWITPALVPPPVDEPAPSDTASVSDEEESSLVDLSGEDDPSVDESIDEPSDDADLDGHAESDELDHANVVDESELAPVPVGSVRPGSVQAGTCANVGGASLTSLLALAPLLVALRRRRR